MGLTFDRPKVAGCCLCCHAECYQVIARDPKTDRPLALGPQLERGTQVTFMLSNGSEADITFCSACAAEITPADYPAIWSAVLRTVAASLDGLSPNQRAMRLRPYTQMWIMGRLRRRREDPEHRGRVIVDRR